MDYLKTMADENREGKRLWSDQDRLKADYYKLSEDERVAYDAKYEAAKISKVNAEKVLNSPKIGVLGSSCKVQNNILEYNVVP